MNVKLKKLCEKILVKVSYSCCNGDTVEEIIDGVVDVIQGTEDTIKDAVKDIKVTLPEIVETLKDVEKEIIYKLDEINVGKEIECIPDVVEEIIKNENLRKCKNQIYITNSPITINRRIGKEASLKKLGEI